MRNPLLYRWKTGYNLPIPLPPPDQLSCQLVINWFIHSLITGKHHPQPVNILFLKQCFNFRVVLFTYHIIYRNIISTLTQYHKQYAQYLSDSLMSV